jgi:undecaprenyl-diphosphatase
LIDPWVRTDTEPVASMTRPLLSAAELEWFRVLNAGRGALVDALAVFLSLNAFGVAFGLVLLVLVGVAAGRRKAELVPAFIAAVALSDFLGARVLRPLLARTRPCYALDGEAIRWLAPAADVGSLPSLHAANFFAMAVVAFAASPALGAAALLVAAAVAWSRVYVGVHWPTDVVCGAVWGLVCALTARAACAKMAARAARA